MDYNSIFDVRATIKNAANIHKWHCYERILAAL